MQTPTTTYDFCITINTCLNVFNMTNVSYTLSYIYTALSFLC